MEMTIRNEKLEKNEYIEFLRCSDLGSQYPEEDFAKRIETLLANVSLSICARDENGQLIGVLLGLTDFAYWLFVTDLGVRKDCERQGIGTALMRDALERAGGEKRIAVYLAVNEKAIPFYEKLGMRKAQDVLVYNHTDFTVFTVE